MSPGLAGPFATVAGFNESPQSGYAAKGAQPLGLDTELAQALGFDTDEVTQGASESSKLASRYCSP